MFKKFLKCPETKKNYLGGGVEKLIFLSFGLLQATFAQDTYSLEESLYTYFCFISLLLCVFTLAEAIVFLSFWHLSFKAYFLNFFS